MLQGTGQTQGISGERKFAGPGEICSCVRWPATGQTLSMSDKKRFAAPDAMNTVDNCSSQVLVLLAFQSPSQGVCFCVREDIHLSCGKFLAPDSSFPRRRDYLVHSIISFAYFAPKVKLLVQSICLLFALAALFVHLRTRLLCVLCSLVSQFLTTL